MQKSLIFLIVFGSVSAWQLSDIFGASAPKKTRQVIRPPMEDIAFEKREALAQISQIRASMGMPILLENTALQKAAQAHADYLVQHHVSAHLEKSGQSGFTGTKPLDRALRAGYGARFVGENLSTKSTDAVHSIDGLFSAIYHRFGFLNLSFDEVGIGIAQQTSDARNSAFVYLMGNSEVHRLCTEKSYQGSGRYVYGVCADTKQRIKAHVYNRARDEIKERNPKIVFYPYDGQREVPPAFYNETPDPLPEYDVSGFPVSVEFNDRYFRKVALISFRLYEEGGSEVAPVRLLDKRSDPHHELTRRQFALLPLKRLAYGTTYRAEVVYRHNKKKRKILWRFTTRQPIETLKTVRQAETTLRLKRGQGYWIYFEPNHPHDVLGTMRYPADLYARFVDPNTLRIVLSPDDSRGFEITGSGRKIRIEIE
jgi:uncharacterized protein YkwD